MEENIMTSILLDQQNKKKYVLIDISNKDPYKKF